MVSYLMEAGNESCAFPSVVACLSQGCAGCQPLRERGVSPPLGTSLPAKSPACKKYCLQRVAWGWWRAGRRRGPFPGGAGSSPRACIPMKMHLLCVGLQGSPSPMASHHAQAELPKAAPLGMVGVETVVAGSWLGWPRQRLCPVLLCSHGQGCRHPRAHRSQQPASGWWCPALVAAFLP